MKNKLLILGILAMIATNVSAQYKEYTYGLKVGPAWHWTTSTDDNTINNQTLISYSLGVFVEKHRNSKLSFSSGLTIENHRGDYSFYDQRSSHPLMQAQRVYVNRRHSVLFIDVPVLVKFKVTEIGPFCPYIQGGINLGYRINAKAKDKCNIGVFPYEDTEYRNVNKDFRAFNASINAGIGCEYELSTEFKAFAQIMYRSTLFNMTALNYARNGGPSIYGNCIALELGIIL